MANKTHNLSIKTGTYEKNGETKGRYLNIGSVFSHDDGGISIKLDCVPVGLIDWEGWVSAYPVDNNRQSGPGSAQQSETPAPSDFDDDINF